MKKGQNTPPPDGGKITGRDAIQQTTNGLLKIVSARVKKITTQGRQVVLNIEGERKKTRVRFQASATLTVDRDHSIASQDIVAAIQQGLRREAIQLPRSLEGYGLATGK